MLGDNQAAAAMRIVELERRMDLLEKEIAQLRGGEPAAEAAASDQWVDARLRSLGRLLIAGRPNPSYFSIRFRAYEAAMMNIKALGYALGRMEANDKLRRAPPPAPPKAALKSKLCTKQDIESDWASFWCAELKQEPRYHRKVWEFVYIAQALSNAGKLAPGKAGLGFGCGREPLSSLFAKYGANIVATDLPDADPRAKTWSNSNQHVAEVDTIRQAHICPDNNKLANISFQSVDMNKKFLTT